MERALREKTCHKWHASSWSGIWHFFRWSALSGRLIYYHYWCWHVGGAVPVKTSTGNNFPSLPFLFFGGGGGRRQRKAAKKQGIFYPYRKPKIPGKEGENARKKEDILGRGEKQGIPKTQGKEGQGFSQKMPDKSQKWLPVLVLNFVKFLPFSTVLVNF